MMDRERFKAMTEAYGADAARWPAEERGAALRFVARDKAAAEGLAAERELDDLMDAWTLAPTDVALNARIIGRAPTRGAAAPTWRRLRFWLSGAGLAAACGAGVLAGVATAGVVVPDSDSSGVLAPVSDVELTS